MIHHLIHKYHIQDPQGEFFQEGMIALWDLINDTAIEILSVKWLT